MRDSIRFFRSPGWKRRTEAPITGRPAHHLERVGKGTRLHTSGQDQKLTTGRLRQSSLLQRHRQHRARAGVSRVGSCGAPQPAEHPVRRLHPTLCSHHWGTPHSPRCTLSPCEKGRPSLQGAVLCPDSCRPRPAASAECPGLLGRGPRPLPLALGLRNLGEHSPAGPSSAHPPEPDATVTENLPDARREPSDAGTGDTPEAERLGRGHGGRRGGRCSLSARRGRSLLLVASGSAGQTADSRGPRVCKRGDWTSRRSPTLTGNLS